MDKKIGIALSGGGIRALLYHLGVLKYLAECGELEHISRISSVSGGSLCVGLVYAHSGLKWPSSEQYLSAVLPKIKQTILSADIQLLTILRLLCRPWNLNRKVNLLGQQLSEKWGVYGNICDLEPRPLWCVNCTTYETGKRFKIMRDLMGDYKTGYVRFPDFPIADAIAASAGFPVLIGPYKLDCRKYHWEPSEYEQREALRLEDAYLNLWDGGVYDNLGLEALFKISGEGRLEPDINYIIISSASSGLGYEKRKSSFAAKGLMRLLSITMDQVLDLRTRTVMDMLIRENNGAFLKIGNDAGYLLRKSPLPEAEKTRLIQSALTPSEVKAIEHYPTTLARPSELNFDLLVCHGYEVAKYTLIKNNKH